MVRIAFRKFVRGILQSKLDAPANAEAYLRECPWIAQLVPLTYKIGDFTHRSGIKVEKVDAGILLTWAGNDKSLYLVTRDGEVIKKLRGGLFMQAPWGVLQRLKEEQRLRVRWIVSINSGWGSRVVSVTIYKFPKAGDPFEHARQMLAAAKRTEVVTLRKK